MTKQEIIKCSVEKTCRQIVKRGVSYRYFNEQTKEQIVISGLEDSHSLRDLLLRVEYTSIPVQATLSADISLEEWKKIAALPQPHDFFSFFCLLKDLTL